jgi:hypothetical protein
MGERINRQDDERIYQPRIHSILIHEIYLIREKTGLPMTVIVDHAIREYLEKYEMEIDPFPQPTDQQV